MNKKFGRAIGALVIALLAVGALGTTSAFADDGGPSGKRGGKHGLDGTRLEVVADVLNMSTDDLSAVLEDGQTLGELAEEASVDMQEIFDTMSVVREEARRKRIAQALEDGTMTQEQADWMLEDLDKGVFFNRGGFGRGDGKFQKPEGSVAPDVNF